ncbi:abnormal spindle-like microcephaly-associated protein homolog [Tribolium castaneum]|uniref:Protein abnormal spindle-like Protein n=1 Tax=Tribolium castaneum TaxID=7070 RepID=D2A1S1_TRICA|nr:PREDICTED: abnormal spindle-like microcephaly-associated protein homolog [Tribolium castaneum]EFA02970.2 Protein abnormal spindle-like Protein [Tribolium castaneum]|eukprot:XP_970176.1 PREDICTED: abnormal spindle-like microcephaly-associated protein homolog [Tribolium castaneum]
MFLQFSPPVRQQSKKPKPELEPDNAVLSLAPFTPNPKICFENVKIGQTATQNLVIKNPTGHAKELIARITIPEELHFSLSWGGCRIDAQSEETLELVWTPTCEGAWRFNLCVTDDVGTCRNVPIVLKAATLTKSKKGTQKRFPRFVAKKNTSPVQNFKRKSPQKRAILPNITNMPTFTVNPPESEFNGKENFNLSPKIETRRDTYTVNQNIPEIFDDSLENITVVKSPSVSFERRLQSTSFLLTPSNQIDFNPERCSTDEKSIDNTDNFLLTCKPKTLFNDTTFEIVKNLSSETYVKNLSSETYTKSDISDNSPSSFSKKCRLDSLVGNGVKMTIEADLWSCHHTNLVTIREETEPKATPLKRKSDVTFQVTSPKRPNLGFPQEWAKQRNIVVFEPEVVTWLEGQEENFKKWLNAVLTPPLDLDSNAQSHPLDVAKLWRSCMEKEIEVAPTREIVSQRFHNNAKLNALRRAAKALYQTNEIQNVLIKVGAIIDCGKLALRKDRDVHLDLRLQADVMQVILSYNPLWLRIGLETIYGRVIPLNSNSDVRGLTRFLWERFMRDPVLLKKHRSVHSEKYKSEIKQFILKKFLALVFFLDRAKSKKLIAHDPCLFCKNAPIKESQTALTTFARDTVSSMGDITKYLKHFQYTLVHKQSYLNEFDYAVKCLGVDLRDGVRLTRVMEIILLQNNLSEKLRVPTVSRLQKIHNMKIVFEALQRSGFEILYDITPSDIVNGHKEKTLSFLWQIIHKLQTPLMAKSVTLITNWWRSDTIVKKRNELKLIRETKNAAAITIQRYVRMFLAKRRYEKLQNMLKFFKAEKQERAVLIIQRRWRATLAMRNQRTQYQVLREATILIQRRFRAKLLHKSVVFVQRLWRAKLAMRQQLYNYQILKETVKWVQSRVRAKLQFRAFKRLKQAAIFVQRCWRAKCERKLFMEMKNAAIVIQRRFRTKLLYERFKNLRWATIVAQREFRRRQARRMFLMLRNATIFVQSYVRMKLARDQFNRLKRAVIFVQVKWRYQALKKATIFVQRQWRAKIAMIRSKKEFEMLKTNTIVIQRRFRANKVAKLQKERFNSLRKAAILIQRQWRLRKKMIEYRNLRRTVVFLQMKWRAKLATRNAVLQFEELKKAVLVIQRRFRANQLAKIARNNFEELKRVTVFVQRKWREKLEMRRQIANFQALKNATVVIQRRFRAKLEARKYQTLKNATISIQKRWRAILLMRIQLEKYQNLKAVTVCIQRRFRANLARESDRNNFINLKKSVIVIQRRFRANKAGKLQRDRFNTLKEATILIQRKWRLRKTMIEYRNLRRTVVFVQIKWKAKLAARNAVLQFEELKKAVLVIQRRFRANQLAKIARNNFEELKRVTVLVQRRWREKLETRRQIANFQALKSATVVIQRRFRAKLEARKYQILRKATVLIQQRWRATLLMRIELEKYQNLKLATICIQRRFRANLARESDRNNFTNLKKSVIVIQRRFRANKAGKLQRDRFNLLKKSAILIQRKWRLRKTMIEYRNLRRTVAFVQFKWRAKLAARNAVLQFEALKKAVLLIQRRFRANQLAKITRNNFEELKRVTVFVQRRWREKLETRRQVANFQALKSAIIVIQRRFRANLARESDRNNFISLKKATVVIQTKWRAELEMRRERNKYHRLKQSVIAIQRQCRKRLVLENKKKDAASVIIQKYVRGLLVRRKFAKFLTPEAIAQRRENAAATKIQAFWRRYKTQLAQGPEVLRIYERLKKANASAEPQNTVGSRCQKAVQELSSGKLTVGELLRVLKDLEFGTSRCKKFCRKLGEVLARPLYETIIVTNRSPAEMEVSTLACSILINFYRFEPTRSATWIPQLIEKLLSVMLHSCDKETALFPTLCTLFWMFAHNEEYKNFIVSSGNFKHKMRRICELCERKAKMNSKVIIKFQSFFVPYKDLPLPSMTPDWGFELKHKPKTFTNSIHALQCLRNRLNVL